MTAVRERRSIRFTLYKFLSTECHDYSAVILWIDEAVVLFCCNSCKWLEPMCEVCCTILNCPFLHCVSNNIGDIKLQWFTVIQSLLKSFECFLWKTIFHCLLVENHASEKFWYICHFITPIKIKRRHEMRSDKKCHYTTPLSSFIKFTKKNNAADTFIGINGAFVVCP